MNRLDQMRDRLPPVWSTQEGTLLRAVLALMANQMAACDEDMDRLQRSHWVDTAFDMDDLIKLGALFQIAAAPWETEGLYRVRLKATVAARLRGAVSRDVLEFVLVAILGGAQDALQTRFAQLPASSGQGVSVFHTGSDGPIDRPAFIEFPNRRRRSDELLSGGALQRPLAKFTLKNDGLFAVPLQGVIRGVAGARTAGPLIANLTTNQVMIYRGLIACGQSLVLGVDSDEHFTAELDGVDVSDNFTTGADFAPGAEFTPVIPDPDPRPLMLQRGENLIWVFPLALFDEPVLGTSVFAMPQDDVGHGRWEGDGSRHPPFDKALFEQPPAMSLDLYWDEATPATFQFRIPAGAVRLDASRDADPKTDRDRLFSLMQDTLSGLRAAGIDGQVVGEPLRDIQHQQDRMRVLDPKRLTETQPMTSRLSGLSALFDTSAVDRGRFE